MSITDRNDDRWTRHHGGWGWILGYGLLLAAIGALALFQPVVTGLATGILLALVLVSGGILGIIAGFSAKGWRSRWLDIVVGLLSLLVGLLAFWNPLFGAFSLVWAIGLWLLVSGALEIAAGLKSVEHRGWLLFLGAIDILLGVYLMLVGPADALVILAVIVGLSFLFRGIFLAIFALRLRSAAV